MTKMGLLGVLEGYKLEVKVIYRDPSLLEVTVMLRHVQTQLDMSREGRI